MNEAAENNGVVSKERQQHPERERGRDCAEDMHDRRQRIAGQRGHGNELHHARGNFDRSGNEIGGQDPGG